MPATCVTSVNVPSPLLRRSEFRISPSVKSHAPRSTRTSTSPSSSVVPADAVEAPELIDEAGAGRQILERAVAAIAIEAHGALWIDRGGDDVEEAVAVEVLHDAATGQIEGIDAQLLGDVRESSDVGVGLERARRDAISIRQTVGMGAERHVREVQQPAHLQVARDELEEPIEAIGRGLGGAPYLVHAATAQRKLTALGVVACDAVLELGLAEVHHPLVAEDLGHHRPHRRIALGEAPGLADLGQTGIDVAHPEKLDAELGVRLDPVVAAVDWARRAHPASARAAFGRSRSCHRRRDRSRFR